MQCARGNPSEDGGDTTEDCIHNPNAGQESREEQPCEECNRESFNHVCSLSDDGEECNDTEQNTFRFQSLRLATRLDRVLTREDDDKANDDGEDGEGDDLAVHAPIITRSPAYASPCTSFHAHSCAPNPFSRKSLKRFAFSGLLGNTLASYMQGLLLL